MHRRRLLGTLAATASGGLAGCGASGSDSSTRTPPSCDDRAPRRVELTGTESVPDAAALSITATVERARFAADGAARLTVTVANDGDDRVLDVRDGSDCHLFNRGRGRSDPRGLWLYRTANAPTDRAGECWTRDAVPPDSVGFDGYACGRYPLAAGDSLTTTYVLWDDYATDGYLPTGGYRFETTVSVSPSEDADEPSQSVDWWLDIAVRNAATTERPQEFTSSR